MKTSNFVKHTNNQGIHGFLLKNFNNGIIKIIDNIKPKSILDVGCGEGFTLDMIDHLPWQKKLSGIDNSKQALKLGKFAFPNLLMEEGDIYKISKPDNSYDMLICTEVLEHLENPSVAVQELKRVTSKYILISVPLEPWFQIGNFLRGKYVSSLGNHPEHVNHWSAKSLLKFLVSHNLEIEHVEIRFPWTIALLKK